MMRPSVQQPFSFVGLLFSLLIVLGPACKAPKPKSGDSPLNYFKEAYTGYNQEGLAESCERKRSPQQCPGPTGAPAEFAVNCTTQGYELYHCDCNHFLCSKNALVPGGGPLTAPAPKEKSASTQVEGYDYLGNKRRCTAMDPQTACTASFGPEDQFAIDCQKAGHRYLQCGCHDYLCTENIAKK